MYVFVIRVTSERAVYHGSSNVYYSKVTDVINQFVFLCVNAIFIVREQVVNPFVLMNAARWPPINPMSFYNIMFVIRLP